MNIANISFDKTSNKWLAMYNGHILAKSGDKNYVILSIKNGLSKKARELKVTDVRDNTSGVSESVNLAYNQQQHTQVVFSINERFEFLSTLTRMVINETAPSLLITGPGGYGKTYSVLSEIKQAGLTFTTDFEDPVESDDFDPDDEDYTPDNQADVHIVKGFSTAKGLYRTLFENNGRLVIFDDCDSIFRDANAVNILKGALDSTSDRWISWNAEARMGDKNPLPRKFLFTGRVIFISNYSQAQIDGAIKSRSLRVDLDMNASEKIERMTTIVNTGNFMPDDNVSIETQKRAIAILDKYKDQATELSMRTLIHVCRILQTNSPDVEQLALYVITA